MSKYDPFAIEPKWQKRWADEKSFEAELDKNKPKYYVLEMLPYPSGQLHVGHVRNYTLGDTYARYKRACGFNVIYPMGWDSFGLPAENAALKKGIHPKKGTMESIAAIKTVMQRFGWSYDWRREIASCTPEYYGHQQALFIDLYENKLAYQKESLVNWDPVDNTVLANEQVVDGKGWRSGAPVERRNMRQWFFKITNYAEELLGDLDQLEGWPARVRTMQENWIGRSEGAQFYFEIKGEGVDGEKLEVYSTRPDTIYGVTFCCLAPEHPLSVKFAESDATARAFIEECQGMGTAEEAIEKAEKKGLKTPYVALHPFTGEELPIYIANFVLMGYGTGAVMAVPAHDARDNEFAKKYNLDIPVVVRDKLTGEPPEMNSTSTTQIMENSRDLDGLDVNAAKAKVIDQLEAKGVGERHVNWRLRDWGVSRQRYWGCPIPMIYCDACGVVPVPKDQLPITLPDDVTFDGVGNPLAQHPTWKNCDCPKCGAAATRETDTMDTFVDSSWYFMRYTCAKSDQPIDRDAINYWMPVDQYIGGIEHAVLHLLYARFFTKALRDCGYVGFDEPFKSLLCQGMVVGPTYKNAAGDFINPADINFAGDKALCKATGEELIVGSIEKLSKSKNNGADPLLMIKEYGADTMRLFMMFTAPPERDLEWSVSAVEGSARFLKRLWALVDRVETKAGTAFVATDALSSKEAKDLKRAIHKGIKKVSTDIERFQYNTMIAAVMELSNTLAEVTPETSDEMAALFREGVEACVRLLNPIVPHITEELWKNLGYEELLSAKPWLEFDKEAAADDEITLVVQVNGKLKERLTVPAGISNEEAEAQALNAIQVHIGGLTVRKCIVVPNRLVNVVVS